MTEFVLYNAPQSTCSQRVRFVLNAKKLAFDEHKLDLFSGDQLKPDYLAINPNGVVPTLVHDGAVIIDSAVIIEYLDEIRPIEIRFTPEDAVERATMRSMMRYIDEIPTPAVRIPSYNLAFLPHFRANDQEIEDSQDAQHLEQEDSHAAAWRPSSGRKQKQCLQLHGVPRVVY